MIQFSYSFPRQYPTGDEPSNFADFRIRELNRSPIALTEVGANVAVGGRLQRD